MGDDQTSMNKYSSGRVEVIEEVENGSLWLLLIRHSEQDNGFEANVEIGNEKLETTVFKMGKDG